RNPPPMGVSAAVRVAHTRADHLALADRYEAVARDMENKAEEHKRILAQFRKDPHDFPKAYMGENFENRTKRLIDVYERAADIDRKLAEAHREMADALK